MECSMKLRKYISSIDHESVQKNLFENCGWCKLHRPADCPKRTVPSPVERSPALHIFLGTRNEAISRRLTCTGMRLIPGLPPFLISQGASVLPSFSNPGAYIPFTIVRCRSVATRGKKALFRAGHLFFFSGSVRNGSQVTLSQLNPHIKPEDYRYLNKYRL